MANYTNKTVFVGIDVHKKTYSITAISDGVIMKSITMLLIYAKKENDSYLLTDDGYILQDLLNCGCSYEEDKMQELLKITLADLGIHLDGDRLNIRASPENFALKKHNLVQAMLAVNDLFYLSSSHT